MNESPIDEEFLRRSLRLDDDERGPRIDVRAIAQMAEEDRATVWAAAAGVMAAAIVGAGIGGVAIANLPNGPAFMSDALALVAVAMDTVGLAPSFMTPPMILATIAAIAIYVRQSDRESEYVSAS